MPGRAGRSVSLCLVSQRSCAQLAAWGTAWLQGQVSFDDVLDAVSAGRRSLAQSGFADGETHPVGSALTDWRRSGATSLRLALPVPGDVRGLAGTAEFRDLALGNGQAVFGPEFGLTCALSPRTASSARRSLCWHRGQATEQQPDYLSIADAEHDLAEAIRETASLLARRDAPSWLTDVAPALSNARRAGERLELPASHPPRAVRVIAQAERMSAVLALVDADPTGEVTLAGMAERGQALMPLRVAVRRALLAGYNATVEVGAN
ncbi:MAG: hypothetical protein JWO63_2914 [Frankiales bacterium]|nr:hypothetical protein [Frankiales bacterium]